MTAKQIEWAAKHDWFLSRCAGNGAVVRDFNHDGVEVTKVFFSFSELKVWAGY